MILIILLLSKFLLSDFEKNQNKLDSLIEQNNYNFIDKYFVNNDTLHFEINDNNQLIYFKKDTIINYQYDNKSDDLIVSFLKASNDLIFLKTLEKENSSINLLILDIKGNIILKYKNLARELFKKDNLYFVTLKNNKFNLLTFNYVNLKLDTVIKNSLTDIYFITKAPSDDNFYTQYFSKDSSFILKINNNKIDTIFKKYQHCYSYIIYDDIVTIQSNLKQSDFVIFKNDKILNFTKNVNDDIVSIEKLSTNIIALLTTNNQNKYLRVYKNKDKNTFFYEFNNIINIELPLFINVTNFILNGNTIKLTLKGFWDTYKTEFNLENKSFSDSSFYIENKYVRIINEIPCFYIESKNKNSKNIYVEAYSSDRINYFPYRLGKIEKIILEESDICYPLLKGSIELGYNNYLNGLQDGKINTLKDYHKLIKHLKNNFKDKKIHLYGDSFGALLALCIGIKAPSIVDELYLNAPCTNILSYLEKHFDQKSSYPLIKDNILKLSPIHTINEINIDKLPKLNLISYENDELCKLEDNIHFFEKYSKINKESTHTIIKYFSHNSYRNDFAKKRIKKSIYLKMYNEMKKINGSINK